MSKQVTVFTACDYPGCSTTTEGDQIEIGQIHSVAPVEFLVYSRGRGRRVNPIIIDLCEEHSGELKELYRVLSKSDQSKDL